MGEFNSIYMRMARRGQRGI